MSHDCATALQPGQQSKILFLKQKYLGKGHRSLLGEGPALIWEVVSQERAYVRFTEYCSLCSQ